MLAGAPEDRRSGPFRPTARSPRRLRRRRGTVGAQPCAHRGAHHGWRVLAILSALMGFASISTDLYLPAMPAMGRALARTRARSS